MTQDRDAAREQALHVASAIREVVGHRPFVCVVNGDQMGDIYTVGLDRDEVLGLLRAALNSLEAS